MPAPPFLWGRHRAPASSGLCNCRYLSRSKRSRSSCRCNSCSCSDRSSHISRSSRSSRSSCRRPRAILAGPVRLRHRCRSRPRRRQCRLAAPSRWAARSHPCVAAAAALSPCRLPCQGQWSRWSVRTRRWRRQAMRRRRWLLHRRIFSRRATGWNLGWLPRRSRAGAPPSVSTSRGQLISSRLGSSFPWAPSAVWHGLCKPWA
mmetsp:Transcript_40559/g.88649  ORF Transcript_40559/g.88649 Transcript_40559/m.88649 type:complete len:203 (-) Transcript_40559:91-699(-)